MSSAHRVLLVEPPYCDVAREPLGLAYLAATLRENGRSVRILCESGSRMVTDERLLEMAADCDVVGFSATSPSFAQALRMARLVKEQSTSTHVVLGGYHGTVLHEVVLERHSEFDAVIRSEGEESFTEYLEGWNAGPPSRPIAGVTHRAGGEILVGPSREPIEDLDGLPLPARDLLPHPAEFPPLYDPGDGRPLVKATVASSRGCPYRCTFCSIISFYEESRIRFRSAENVLAELEELVREYGVECIHFCDDNFLVSPRRSAILTTAAEAGLDVAFRITTRADQIVRARDVLPVLVECGLIEVELGIENGSQSVLNRYAKNSSVDMNIEALHLLTDLGVSVYIDYILFDPFTTVQELLDNLSFLKSHLPPGYPSRKCVFSKLGLYPGTPSYEQVIAQKLYRGDRYHLPTLVFQDPEVAEVYDLIAECHVEARRFLDAAESLSREMLRLIELEERRKPGSQNRRLGEVLLLQVPLNRMALNLFERVMTLRQASRGRPMPTEEVQRIRDTFIDTASTLHRDLELLRGRLDPVKMPSDGMSA